MMVPSSTVVEGPRNEHFSFVNTTLFPYFVNCAPEIKFRLNVGATKAGRYYALFPIGSFLFLRCVVKHFVHLLFVVVTYGACRCLF